MIRVPLSSWKIKFPSTNKCQPKSLSQTIITFNHSELNRLSFPTWVYQVRVRPPAVPAGFLDWQRWNSLIVTCVRYDSHPQPGRGRCSWRRMCLLLVVGCWLLLLLWCWLRLWVSLSFSHSPKPVPTFVRRPRLHGSVQIYSLLVALFQWSLYPSPGAPNSQSWDRLFQLPRSVQLVLLDT